MDSIDKSYQQLPQMSELWDYRFEFLALLEGASVNNVKDDTEQLITYRQQLSSSEDFALTNHGVEKYNTAYINIISHIKSNIEKEDENNFSLFDSLNCSLSGFKLLFSILSIIALVAFLFLGATFLAISSQYNIVIIGLLIYVTWKVISIIKERIKYLARFSISKFRFMVKYIQKMLLIILGVVCLLLLISSFMSSLITTDDIAIISLSLGAFFVYGIKENNNELHQAAHWLILSKDKR